MNCCLCGSTDMHLLFKWGRDDIVRCRSCGLIADRTKLLSNYQRVTKSADWGYYKDPSDAVFWHDNRFPIFSRAIRLLKQEKTSGRLLDIGCGFGHFLDLARAAGYAVSGVDLDPISTEYARKHYGLDVRTQSLREAGYQSESFDVVTLWNVLDFFDDPCAEMREVNRILKPNGVVAVRVPNGAVHANLRRFFIFLQKTARAAGHRDPSVFHTYAFTPKTLRVLLEKNGFSIFKSLCTASSVPPALKRTFSAAVTKCMVSAYTWFAAMLFAASAGKFNCGSSLLVFARKKGNVTI